MFFRLKVVILQNIYSNKKNMNYEEMLSSGNAQLAKGALMPIGFLHKKLREGKFDNVLDLRRHLSDGVLFAKNIAIKSATRRTATVH